MIKSELNLRQEDIFADIKKQIVTEAPSVDLQPITTKEDILSAHQLLHSERRWEVEKDMGMRSMLTMATQKDLLFVGDAGGWTGVLKITNDKSPNVGSLKKWDIFKT